MKRTTTILTVIAIFMVCSSIYAKEGRPREGGKHMTQGARSDMVMKVLENPEVAEKLGLEEDQVEKMKKKLYELKKKQIQVEADHQLAALEQAHLMTAKEIDEKALMKAIDKAGKLRTEKAKLVVKQMLVLKKGLTEEQTKQLHSVMRKQHQGKKGPKRPRAERGGGERGEGDERRGWEKQHGRPDREHDEEEWRDRRRDKMRKRREEHEEDDEDDEEDEEDEDE